MTTRQDEAATNQGVPIEPEEPQHTIRVGVVVIVDERGRVLTVRKRGTDTFILPGGKLEKGETARAAAVREAAEELGIELDPACLDRIGTFTAAAAHERGELVMADAFLARVPVSPQCASEIVEYRWQVLDDVPAAATVAPLLRDEVFPAVRAHHALSEFSQHNLE